MEYVKGHALPRHIAMGLTTDKDIHGNNGSDEIAGIAAREFEGTGIEASIECSGIGMG